jgi:hypothetical protein
MVDLKKMQMKIDEMAKAFGDPMVGEEEIQEEDTQEEEIVEETTDDTTNETKEVEDINSAEQEDDPKPGEALVDETQPPEQLEPEEDPRDKAIRELRDEINQLKKSSDTPTQPPKEDTIEDLPISDEDFLADIDPDDLYNDPKLFKDILNRVYKKAREDSRKEIKGGIESVVRSIPDITKNTVAIQAQLAKVRDEFYKENKDLLPWSTSVAAVMEELISKNPDKHYNELLQEVATETRRRLSLQKQVDNKNRNNPPPLPKKKGGQRTTPNPDLSDLDKEIAEMDKALGID